MLFSGSNQYQYIYCMWRSKFATFSSNNIYYLDLKLRSTHSYSERYTELQTNKRKILIDSYIPKLTNYSTDILIYYRKGCLKEI